MTDNTDHKAALEWCNQHKPEFWHPDINNLAAAYLKQTAQLSSERKANDLIAQERDAFQEAMERERKAREELYKETIAIASTGQADFKRANAAEAKLTTVEAETIEFTKILRIFLCEVSIAFGHWERQLFSRNGPQRDESPTREPTRMLNGVEQFSEYAIRALAPDRTAAGQDLPQTSDYQWENGESPISATAPTLGRFDQDEINKRAEALRLEGMEEAAKLADWHAENRPNSWESQTRATAAAIAMDIRDEIARRRK